jgi:hypothetical protein
VLRLAQESGQNIAHDPAIYWQEASRKEEEELWTLIGPAYVHGFMDGLPHEWPEKGICKERRFILV